MAQISFEDVRTNEGSDFAVGFFSLKHDGDEAIVRILCDTIQDLDIMTVHPITVGQSAFPNREVSCLRTPHEPLENCPLCNSGEKVKQRVYIKMLQYDPQTREPSAVVWNRPAGAYVPKLKSYIDNYGPLSQIMCKIIRHGSGLDTTYDIIPNLNPQQYTLDAYRLDTSDFEDFKVLGRMVYDKTADEIVTFMQTGNFPQKQNDNTQQSVQSQPQPIPGGYSNMNPNPPQQNMELPKEFYGNPPQANFNQPPMDNSVPPMQGVPSMNQSPLDNIPNVDQWGNPIPPQNQGMGRPQRY